MTFANDSAATAQRPRCDSRFLRAHPAHWVALGFGAGLSPRMPGTIGTLWAWLAFAVMSPWLSEAGWGGVLVAALALGWWACSRTAQHLGTIDPGAIVWDEVIAFWLVLWLLTPASWTEQLLAFALFRYFDAAKPGPVGWADHVLHARALSGRPGAWWYAGAGILFDDLVAAFCTLLCLALWRLA